MKRSFMMRSVRNLLETCLNLKPQENFLILTDTNKIDIAEMFALVGREMDAEVVLLIMAPRTCHGEEPPRIVSEAMKAADVIMAPTTFSVNHSNARKAASDAGARLIFMSDACYEVFLDGSLDIDFLVQHEIIQKVGTILGKANHIKISSKLGTDLTMDVAGRHPVIQTGICHEPGTISPPPCIEAAVAPIEGSTNGIIFIDGAIVPGGVCNKPIKIRFENGRIVAIEGEKEAEKLKSILEEYNDPNIYCAVEMGMGMNPKAKIGQGGPLEDEAEFGTMHIGIGNGITFGSSIRAKGHCDLVMRDAIIEIDGKILMKNKELFFDNFNIE
ncbi:MAG: aminopeptidase [Dysgonamonadaceae bacterium]|nr:aminopeptidase [Dysgonamonadaceae bacterium]